MRVAIQKLRSDAVVPRYATPGSAGFDLVACVAKPVVIAPQQRVIIPTGIAIALPTGYEMQVRGRSGLAAKHGIALANGIGTIDSDYRGEIGVILLNSSRDDFMVEPGMRIAQGVISRYETAEWDEVTTLDETVRGTGGYGSTG